MLVFTSINNFYLPKARVLVKSLKKFHPDWKFVLLLADKPSKDFNINNELFDYLLTLEELPIDNLYHWMFQYNIEELCTAIKPIAADYLIKKFNIKKILYLDPDVKIFSHLSLVENLLDKYDIILTPHLLEPENTIEGFLDNELSASKHGIFNLGFFATSERKNAKKFLEWWSSRLKNFCVADTATGLWTDQKICDFVPAFFENYYILKNPGFNVATWNITNRKITKEKNNYYINKKELLVFYHFTGYDSGDGENMLIKYADNNRHLFEIWNDYKKSLSKEQTDKKYQIKWFFEKYSNGHKIKPFHRIIYTQSLLLQKKFPNPFKVNIKYFLIMYIEGIRLLISKPFRRKKISGKYYSI